MDKILPPDNNSSVLQFVSYFFQVDLPIRLQPKNILEIGIGDNTTSNYLKQHNLDVVTCDIDKNRYPNYVSDIKYLPFRVGSFDIVLAYEVIEHLPWENINHVFEELHRISRKYVIISVPYASHNFEIAIKFPLIRRLLKKDFIDIFFRIPYPVRDIKNIGDPHYWEIGRKSYPMKKFKKVIEKYFKIKREIRPTLHSYHHFMILERI